MNRYRDEQLQDRHHALEDHAVVGRETAVIQREGAIVYRSEAIRSVIEQARLVASTSATVLLLGETGVGKEVFAEAIHEASARGQRPMIRVNCAAIPAALIERELFGHERGAFTDAWARQIGRFEAAHQSTLFLDEIGELPLEMQVKLLRVLEDRTIERLGSPTPIKVDVRIIAATNRDLEEAVLNKTFREDLFYRLNVFPVTIPPLRERPEDIPALVWTFVDELSQTFGRKIDTISKRSLSELQRYSWPGNVRELRNLVEREMIMVRGSTLTLTVPAAAAAARRGGTRLVEVQVEHIRTVLESCGWRIRGASGAAQRLGVKPTTLESRMAGLGISRNSDLSLVSETRTGAGAATDAARHGASRRDRPADRAVVPGRCTAA
jgi:formate hydrogenlyase transcriptional activator